MNIIQTKLNPRSAEFQGNSETMGALVSDLRDKVTQVKQGGGEAARQKHAARGKRWLDAGQPEKAVGAFWDAINELPGVPDYRYWAGEATFRAKRPAEAEGLLAEAIAIAGVDAPAKYHRQLGEVRMALARFADAIAPFEQAIAKGDDGVDVHRHLQDALRAAGRVEEARNRYADRVAARPDDGDAHYLHARLIEDAAAREAAIGTALARTPTHRSLRYMLAQTRIQQTRYPEAAALFRTLADEVPTEPKPRFMEFEAALAAEDMAWAKRALAILEERFPDAGLTKRARRHFEGGPPGPRDDD